MSTLAEEIEATADEARRCLEAIRAHEQVRQSHADQYWTHDRAVKEWENRLRATQAELTALYVSAGNDESVYPAGKGISPPDAPAGFTKEHAIPERKYYE